MANGQSKAAPQGLRVEAGQSKSNMFTLRKSVRDVLMIFYALGLLNVLIYNTGFIPWEATNGDVIWSTVVGTTCVIGVVMLKILDK